VVETEGSVTLWRVWRVFLVMEARSVLREATNLGWRKGAPNDGMQRTSLRAAADAER